MLHPRWFYRFDNFKRAFILLSEAIELTKNREVSLLEKEGIIQRFEYTLELAWKTLKDYLDYTGMVLDTITPASVLKAAFAAQIIDNGDMWMQALKARNIMSHTYDVKVFEQTIVDIREKYLLLLEDLYEKFLDL